MTTQALLTMAIGVVIPLANGLLTKYEARKARVYLQLVLNAANGFVVEWLNALTTGTDYNVREALVNSLLSLVVAIASQAGVWAPLGASDAAKRSLVGAGSARN
ncbi:hypothetical protein [Kibdelosporangium phytohabitans]|uniref:Holin n=1 Tax=Kibdelosporangium phytohabitans TaxID=860235 RepID=A0A0N9HL81_9PSEU|nr:hypothetical protein [Kibdelosporangium phytohabitans]ALG06862.1 hypothetical protein AOZ06_07875 [Kibdelosporangium phytohabitans]MBE1468109.1 uncharacterized membrane protein (DUF441 family) [Kibdelosporangium phytohabitans]